MAVPDNGLGPWLHGIWLLVVTLTVIRHVTNYSEAVTASGGFKETRLAVRELDSQSGFPPFCDVRRFDLAALYTLQYGLTGDSKRAGGLLHGDEAITGRGGEARFQRVGHSDPPRRAGGRLFAGDQTVVQPTMQG